MPEDAADHACCKPSHGFFLTAFFVKSPESQLFYSPPIGASVCAVVIVRSGTGSSDLRLQEHSVCSGGRYRLGRLFSSGGACLRVAVL